MSHAQSRMADLVKLGTPRTPPHSWWSCVRNKANSDQMMSLFAPGSMRVTTPKSEVSAPLAQQRRRRPLADVQAEISLAKASNLGQGQMRRCLSAGAADDGSSPLFPLSPSRRCASAGRVDDGSSPLFRPSRQAMFASAADDGSVPIWATITTTLPLRRHTHEKQAILAQMGGRAKSLPVSHIELRPAAPAGSSTIELDQPLASNFLRWSRRHGEPHAWRTSDDGLVLGERFLATRCGGATPQDLGVKRVMRPSPTSVQVARNRAG